MERNNNRSSASEYFMCKKMRQALATCPALRAIPSRFSKHRQQSKTVAIHSNTPPSSSSSPPVRTIHIHTSKPPQDSSSEAIPINFDYSVPAAPGSRDHHASVTRVGVAEKYEKKDMNNLFEDYIQRTKYKIRTVSNAGRGGHQGDGLADDKDTNNNKDHGGVKKKDNHKEQISNFIHIARRKIRTTSGITRD